MRQLHFEMVGAWKPKKGILDGLQGAFYEKALGKKRDKRRSIRNDRSVCRAVVEKQHLPKQYANQ